MNDLHFAHPLFLWALAVLPFLAALIFHAEKCRRIALDKLIADRLQPRLAGSVSIARRRTGFALLLIGIALAVIALARPQWGFTWEEKRQSGRDVIFAIDTSKSMLATDLLPNRLTRAKLAAEDLLNQIEGDRVGLIAFAGSSFLQAPLTSDFGAVRDSLQELDTDIIPRGGTNLADAIKAADEAFGKGESEHRALIIFSDGEELEADAVVSARTNKDRFHIFTVGLGSPDGSLIPVPTTGGGTEFLRDDQGQYVKSKLDEARMREVAEAGGGFYVHLQNGPAEMQQIVRDGLGKMKEHETDARFSRVPIERYQWPLAAAVAAFVAAMLLGERRRAQAVKIAAALVLALAHPGVAKNVGIDKFHGGDYRGALEEFEKELQARDIPELHFNAGTAAYEMREYDRAVKSFSRALEKAGPGLKTRASYNLGNALAQRSQKLATPDEKLNDLRDAKNQLDEVLKADPANENARANEKWVQNKIKEAEKEKKDEKKDQQKNEDQKDDQKKDQKDKQDSSQKDGEGKDQKDSKEDKKDQEKSKEGSKNEQKDGEVKAANPGQQEPGKEDSAAEAAEAAQAAKEGRMTEKNAVQILDALKQVDRRVRLLDPKDEPVKNPNRPFKNW